jgi:hypothetical protein
LCHDLQSKAFASQKAIKSVLSTQRLCSHCGVVVVGFGDDLSGDEFDAGSD